MSKNVERSRRASEVLLAVRHQRREIELNIIVWLVVGGLLGWIASVIMRTDAQQGLVLNVVVGVIGALLAGLPITPLVGGAAINQGDLSVAGLVVSLLGAVILLAIVNLFRRERAR